MAEKQFDFVTEKWGGHPPKLSKGYAAQPGTGPEGETCGSCRNCVLQGGVANRYWKCARTSTRSDSTDIRKKMAACEHWEEIECGA